MTDERETFLKNKETDIDQLLVTFTCWQKNFSSITNENEVLKQKVKSFEEQVSLLAVNESLLQEEISNMKKVYEKFQQMLEKKCTIEDENWKLKESVKTLKDEKSALEQDINKRQKDWEVQEMKRKEEAREAMSQAMNEIIEQNERARSLLENRVKQSEAERQKLQQEVHRLEKEKHAEVTKLRLKYDAKLLQLQQDTSKAQQHASKTAVNSTAADIFRQKYVNAKQSSEREIATLKRTITELQRKLEQRAGTPNLAKKRRF